MAFDDLARHMASRDGHAVTPSTDASDFIRQAAEDNRRIQRRNDVILGAILLVGGLIMSTFIVLLMIGAERRTLIGPAGMVGAAGAIVFGAQRVWRGLR